MWRLKKVLRIPPLWEYEVAFSSHGLIYGYALTKRRAEKKLLRAQGRLWAGD